MNPMIKVVLRDEKGEAFIEGKLPQDLLKDMKTLRRNGRQYRLIYSGNTEYCYLEEKLPYVLTEF